MASRLDTNCVIFNDGAFDDYTKKEVRDEKTVTLEHGKPLVFGTNKDKGIKMDGFTPVVVNLNEGYSVDDLLVHNEKDSTLAYILANMTYNSALPRPVGVFQSLEKGTYDDKVLEQINHEQEKYGEGSLKELLLGEDYWQVV